MTTVVGWILEPSLEHLCQGCFAKPAQSIVALDDGLTVLDLCDDCVPPGTSDPIAMVLAIALADDPPTNES